MKVGSKEHFPLYLNQHLHLMCYLFDLYLHQDYSATVQELLGQDPSP